MNQFFSILFHLFGNIFFILNRFVNIDSIFNASRFFFYLLLFLPFMLHLLHEIFIFFLKYSNFIIFRSMLGNSLQLIRFLFLKKNHFPALILSNWISFWHREYSIIVCWRCEEPFLIFNRCLFLISILEYFWFLYESCTLFIQCSVLHC